MLNVLVANYNEEYSTATLKQLTNMLNVQVWNAKRLGWNHEDILIYTNFYYAPMYGQLRYLPVNTAVVKGTKTGLVSKLLPHLPRDQTIWVHDLDAWQTEPFTEPYFEDIGIVPYAPNNPKYNSGSVFYRTGAADIMQKVWNELQNQDPQKCIREEFIINDVFFKPEFAGRITPLDFRYNLGTNQYAKRFNAATKPVIVRHFHPEDEKGWNVHADELPKELKSKLEGLR
jgi:hypothetical protein